MKFFILFLLTGCSYMQYERIPYANDISQDQVEQVSDFVLSRLNTSLGDEWKVKLVNEYITCKRTTNNGTYAIFADGLTQPEKKLITVYVYQPCIAASSLIHEMMHALGFAHGDPNIWKLSRELQKEAVVKFCGPDYRILPAPEPSVEVRSKKIKNVCN